MTASPSLTRALAVLHYAFPVSVFAYYFTSLAVAACTIQARAAAKNSRHHARRRLITTLLSLLVASYALQILFQVIAAAVQHKWAYSQDITLSNLSCVLIFGTELALLVDSEHPAWYSYHGSWIIASIFEPAIFIIERLSEVDMAWSLFEILNLVVWATRYLIIITSLLCCITSWNCVTRDSADDDETQPLVSTSRGQATANYPSYGGTTQSSASDSTELPWERGDRKARATMMKKLQDDGSWFTYIKRFRVFIPYIWPIGHLSLQLRAVLVGVCLLAGNAFNVLIPRQLGYVIDCLSGERQGSPWTQVAFLLALKWLYSEAGLHMLRTWLWMPVEYYSVEEIDKAAYAHILNLSCDFHDSKSASDLVQAISKGESIAELLESVCFHAIPMLIDLAVAFLYLSYAFGAYEGFITLTTAITFLYSTSRLVGGLRQSRRFQLSALYEEHFIRLAGIQGWHTVSQFNQIPYEENRHSNAVRKKVSTYMSFTMRFYFSRAVQHVVLLTGLLAGSFLAVYQVLNKTVTAGQFVMLLTYWAQLSVPLDFFSDLWKKLAQNLVNAERLLEIMETKPSIESKEGAPKLQLAGGAVTFTKVGFSYDNKKEILKNVTFKVPMGQTVAFVGATGAGKSTLLKLLNRFYDVTTGSVEIDGQDIRDVDLHSLRAHIGVVPQSPILFNDTVMNNIRYARLSATDEEVFEACRAACIHDQIVEFSDGYKTIVGERGVKLSGGELQRVAIARAILKRPEIVLLDEATSAVDTETEQKIQDALKTLCNGRTTFIVAHRLSTVVNADQIIVVGDGKIVEKGSHEELLCSQGRYAKLWSRQAFVKSKKKDGDSGDPMEADLLDFSLCETSKVAETTTTSTGDSDTSSSSSSRRDKCICQKKGRSKLDPAAPEFTPLNTLSCASTIHSEPSPVDGTFSISSNQPSHKEQKTEFANRTRLKAEEKHPDDAKNSAAYADEAADDEKESLNGQDYKHEKSAELSKYRRPRCSIGVKSKSESGMEGSSGDAQS